jgi:hypothetical protein
MPQTNLTNPITIRNPSVPAFSMSPIERKLLAIQGLAGASSITDLANGADTSRKFVYTQMKKIKFYFICR